MSPSASRGGRGSRTLVELAALEQRCCHLLRIGVAFEAADALTLELGGDEDVRDFLAGDVLPS